LPLPFSQARSGGFEAGGTRFSPEHAGGSLALSRYRDRLQAVDVNAPISSPLSPIRRSSFPREQPMLKLAEAFAAAWRESLFAFCPGFP